MVESSASIARRVATHLLNIGAVTLSPQAPYTWASGLKSPVYCDNRLTMAFPPIRRAITEGFEALLRHHRLAPQVVVGTATAGIPHAAWLADRLSLPMAYVRAKPKAHGRGNQIEGQLQPGQHVVIIEDLISTGQSSMRAVEAVRAQGAPVEALLAVFSYGFEAAHTLFAGAVVPVHTLTSFEVLVEVAEAQGSLSAPEIASLLAWRNDPQGWSESRS